MTEFYISFASDNTFLGGTVVAARTPTEALEVATSLGRNPGGEAAILEVPSLIENEPDIAVLRTKLVGKEEMLSLGGVKQGDLPESQQELINSAATKICGDCND